jgi:mannose-6-phosphate isomerase-like protein (cupin superfamily)
MAKIALHETLAALSNSGERYKRLIERQIFDVAIYRPGTVDDQTPHARDELYVIAGGSGEFLCGDKRETFAPGDAFFVEAGIEHRFENYSDDFSTWVIFFGINRGRKE